MLLIPKQIIKIIIIIIVIPKRTVIIMTQSFSFQNSSSAVLSNLLLHTLTLTIK